MKGRELKYTLTAKAIQEIKVKAEASKASAEKIRLLCIYWAGKGKPISWISAQLLMPGRTIYEYLNEYHQTGKIDNTPRGGSVSHLDQTQTKQLVDHLDKTVYLATKAICHYVEQQFNMHYSLGGMSKWLYAHGFRYKRPRSVPKTVSAEKQHDFIAHYQRVKSTLTENEEILFMDGVHPDHQTQAVHGWIRRSTLAQVPTTGKQKRVHYLGVIRVTDQEVTYFFKDYETINSEKVIDFFSALLAQKPGKKLKVICDRGAYHTSKETKAFVESHADRLELIYLPPRSPNLNVIERLWKMMREHVTYNRYYAHFKEFKSAVALFFDKTMGTLQSTLLSRLRDNFHIVSPKFLQC